MNVICGTCGDAIATVAQLVIEGENAYRLVERRCLCAGHPVGVEKLEGNELANTMHFVAHVRLMQRLQEMGRDIADDL